MSKSHISAYRIQCEWLKALRHCWEHRPGPNQYFPAQQVWDTVYQKFPKDKIDGPLAEGVMTSLVSLSFIDVKHTDKIIAVRITNSGLAHLTSIEEGKRTRNIAYIGVASGLVGIVLSVIALALKIRGA